ncbi:MAG: pitrilysin family protein [Deltaproteobacteria bacterium]|nr:pitrilysin family protein [Deltaproteobacteria bacterium]
MRINLYGQLARLILATLLLGSAAAAAQESPQVLGIKRSLPNGLVWLFSEQHGLPLVTLQVTVKAGVLRDPPGKAGLANLTALLLLQGTKQRSATQIAEELDFLGARLSASGNDDYALISFTVLKKDLAAGLDLFQDVLLNPAFPAGEVKQKVSQVLASFQSDEDEPGIVASRAFHRALFENHPYGHPAKGTPEGLKAIRRNDLVDFYRTYYRPNNAILSIAGDLTQQEAEDMVDKVFGSWESASIPELKIEPPASLNKTEIKIINKDITQANIVWGHLGIARDNPDFYAFQVMNYILGGGGFASRLVDNIRENLGLAYSVGSSFNPGLEPGPFAVGLETKNASAGEAVAQVIETVKRLRTEPVSEKELNDAKSFLIGSFPRKMDSLAKRASLMGYVEFYNLGLDYPWRYPELLKNITPADIQTVAKKYLHPDRYLLVVVGNEEKMRFTSSLPSPGEEEKKNEAKSN